MAEDREAAQGWRRWITTSPASLRIDRFLVVADGTALLGAALVIINALVRQRPIPGIAVLAAPGVPLVFLGQFWTIGVMTSQLPSDRAARRRVLLSRRSPRAFFFRNLSNRAGYALTAVIVLVWLAGATAALPWFSRGTPGDPIPGCRWTLDNHGAITCVSHATYLHAEAALQRFVAGVFAFFYTIHLGAAAAELVRRRSENV